ncbi:ATP-binding cassette domain-containing protein [Actinoallomurus rhizosphaericola]|uniref:ATP-binding cassette domain-containing protein n=1 Tax=Actinoallomurus rhizosphaericola TaxID=2952536 RepID=UPI002092DB1E|nr:ATP-binding cassette domain-containing protein [Actinoallomurus rhizosphaericola]MCO5995138.1 ATP-binding cassette domain-containing protein [Actinoallomurus rhizosphaericola]
MTTTDLAVAAEGLRKRYGGTAALDGLDLAVPAGTVRGLLGPNGAGKTTTVRILATLLRPDEGHATVAGFDVLDRPAEVRPRIGLLGQRTAVDEILSGRQNLELFGRLHHLGARAARARATELLDRFGLGDAGGKPVGRYSGGMRRRLDLAAALILAPAVLFLDEPTTGLDPRGRLEMWDAVRALAREGTTVLLTTHYLDEADHLADTISVVDHGRVVAEGTPDELKSRTGDDRIDVVVRDPATLPVAAELLGRVSGTTAHVDPDLRRAGAPVRDRATALTGVVRALADAGIDAEDIALRRPTLDEVFLHLTGHRAGEPNRNGQEVPA